VTAPSPSDGENSPSTGELAVTRPGAASAESIGIGALQVLMTAGMPPLDSCGLGDWLLRSADGYTGRANSALPVGDPGMPLPEAIERVRAWYAERGQPALIQLPHHTDGDPARTELGVVLAQRGWRFVTRTLVMTRASSAASSGTPTPAPSRVTAPSPSDGEISPSLGQVAVTREPAARSDSAAGRAPAGAMHVVVTDAASDDWWASASPRALEHRRTLERVMTHIAQASYLTAYVGDRPVGHARLAFHDGWSGIFDVHTDPAARRTGVARTMMTAAARVAVDRRIALQYLQVAADNEAAVKLYESLGWRVHHAYHYATWRPADG